MSQNNRGKPVAVVVGATSKWQSDGRNTLLAHGKRLDDSELPVGIRWGVGGAIAQKFAHEGFFTVLTTRTRANAAGLEAAIREQGGDCNDRRTGPILAGLGCNGIRHDPRRGRRSRCSNLQRRLPGGPRPSARRKNCWNTFRWKCSTPPST
jgi:NAD(P)-dependent dehydrogenase (short-subunit alcohol dehydrogenase family)